MGTRTYSRRGSDGIQKPTALGIRLGRFASPMSRAQMDTLRPLFEDVLTSTGRPYPQSRDTTPIYSPEAQQALERIYAIQGFNGKPTVVSVEEMAKRISNNEVQTEHLTTIEPNEFQKYPVFMVRAVSRESNLDSLMNDDEHHVPRQPGWFGTGTYFTAIPTWVKQPISKSQYDMEYDEMMRQMLDGTLMYSLRSEEYRPSSNQTNVDWFIEGQSRIPAIMMGALSKESRTNISEIRALKNRHPFKGNYDLYNHWVRNLTDEFVSRYGFGLPDIGTMAAALGYDAIYIPNDANSGGEIMLLNRSKLILAEVARGKGLNMDDVKPVLETFRNNLTRKLPV